MSFYPALYRPFSEERHAPLNPPATVVPSTRHHQAESLASTASLGFSKGRSKHSPKVSSKGSSKGSPTQPSFPSKVSFTRSRASTTSSATPSSAAASSYISLALHVQNPFAGNAGLSQNAVFFHQEGNPPWYTPPVPIDDIPTCFPIVHSTAENLTNVPGENGKLSKIISKTPRSIISNFNFGNPWYVLEIQETSGEPYFALVATYSYQLLLSALKCPSQLCIQTFEMDEEGESTRDLYVRQDLAYQVQKLGKLCRVGYLREEDVGNNSKRVFIKMLDLDDEDGKREQLTDRELALQLMRQTEQIYNEIILLDKIPFHPHIMSPIGYITLGGKDGSDKDGDKVVGYISDYYKNGRLSDYLFLPGIPGKPRVPRKIKLIQKAKWAYQIVSAVKHLHRMAQISLGGVGRGFGLERFMIDEYMQLHLIGFGDDEKVSRLSWRVPPEAHVRGEWDVTVGKYGMRDQLGRDKLIWKRNNYVRLMFEKENLAELKEIRGFDPKPTPALCSAISPIPGNICSNSGGEDSSVEAIKSRLGLDEDRARAEDVRKGVYRRKQYFKDWSAFKEWRDIPRALEMVETYSVGIMLWLLFEQIAPETLKDGEDIPITWTESENWTQCWPIPRKWRRIVEACVKVDPSERLDLDRILETFVKEVGKRWDVGWVMG